MMNAKSITIPEGEVTRILIDGEPVWKKNPLPAGYTALHYIQTDGTQYINTNFRPNYNTRVVMDFALTRTDILNGIFGGRNTTTDNAYYFDITDAAEMRFGYGDARYLAGTIDTDRHTADLNKNVFRLDGLILGTAEESTSTAGKNLYLGAVMGSKVYHGYVRIYSCQVYDDGTLMRDFLPCINADGEIGMYDKLNGVFYGNAGSGEFITAT